MGELGLWVWGMGLGFCDWSFPQLFGKERKKMRKKKRKRGKFKKEKRKDWGRSLVSVPCVFVPKH